MSWTVSLLEQASGGKLSRGEGHVSVGKISTDTRALTPGDCFVALAGERFDAHDFLPAAVEAGARVLVVSKTGGLAGIPAHVAVIVVEDTLVALGELARFHRLRHRIPVVGVSGSNGKTSTREMIAGILSLHRDVLKNYGNFNNLIGVPLTLLGLEERHRAAVVEMGISVPGEMARLARIAAPTVGVVTNIHPAHLEGLGSLDGILREKAKLWDALEEDGLAVVNMDDKRLFGYSEGLRCRKIAFSLSNPDALVRVDGTVGESNGASRFRLLLGGESVEVRLPVAGMHHVQNALAAAAVAWGMGESPEMVAEGLSRHQAVKQRMQMRPRRGGGMIVDDSYNANPGSMLAAVVAVRAAAGANPVAAVLGEMRELGEDGPRLHRDIGRNIGGMGLRLLVAMGDLGIEILEGAKEAGMPAQWCRHAATHDEAAERVRSEAPSNAWVLVKGSRTMAMERVVEGLME